MAPANVDVIGMADLPVRPGGFFHISAFPRASVLQCCEAGPVKEKRKEGRTIKEEKAGKREGRPDTFLGTTHFTSTLTDMIQ